MRDEDVALIQSKHSVAIKAPAGHGKTEMIVELVAASPGKVLLLTHTNAGVNALYKRLKEHGVNSQKYSIWTIAGFSLQWCNAYPKTADKRDIPITDKKYYQMLYEGTALIFQHVWARDVLRKTYVSVIVDEYQDCIESQQQIFVEINKTLPIVVLGDPLQAIFGWAGKLVSWKDMPFEEVDIETYPWRWKNTNPKLGKYLSDIRPFLEPGLKNQKVKIEINDVDGCVRVLPSSCKNDYSLINAVRRFDSVVYISKWIKGQQSFARRTGGLFQNDEAQDMKELFDIAKSFDRRDGQICAESIFELFEMCATGVNKGLSSYKRKIEKEDYDFKRIRKYPEFGRLIISAHEEASNESIIAAIDWIQREKDFKLCRKEMISEMRRALIFSTENHVTVLKAAETIRSLPNLKKRYSNYRFLSSRTVLSKGLEFDCVILDLEDSMSVTDYYVALTRAKKMIYLVSDKNQVTLEAPRL